MARKKVIPETFTERLPEGGNQSVGRVLAAQSGEPQPDMDALAVKDVDTLTDEILSLKTKAGEAIIGIGKRLIAVKEKLPHGEWLPWLEEKVEFSERSAQNLMRLAREWTNPHAVADLGMRKALTLLALPPDERETFIAKAHVVDGEEKTVAEMSTRELETAIQERDEALKNLHDAQEQLDQTRHTLQFERNERDIWKTKLDETQAKLDETQTSLRGTLQDYNAAVSELKELKNRPVEIAVQVDTEAVERARREAVAETEARMKEQLAASEKAREKAEKAAKNARADAETEKSKTEEAVREAVREAETARDDALKDKASAEAELQKVRAELDEKSKLSDSDIALFVALFGQIQEQIKRLNGVLLKVSAKDPVKAENLKKSFLSLADVLKNLAGEVAES